VVCSHLYFARLYSEMRITICTTNVCLIQQDLDWEKLSRKEITPPSLPRPEHTPSTTEYVNFRNDRPPKHPLKLLKCIASFRVRKSTLSDVSVYGAYKQGSLMVILVPLEQTLEAEAYTTLKVLRILWLSLGSSSGSIVSGYGLDYQVIEVRFPAGAKDFSCSLSVQTSSGAHPASCTMGTGGTFPGLKRDRGVTLTTHPNLVPRSRMSRSYTSTPLKSLRGV
jgi:hypothetical protein